MEGSVMFGLDRKSSIENEPLTLNTHQFQFAREAALHVMNTNSIEEARRVFTEGLEPIVKCASNNEYMIMELDEEIKCSSNLTRIRGHRDIASAPF